jgi:hypothetical protein
MLTRTRLGLSIDGFIATLDGRPAFLAMPDFVPHSSMAGRSSTSRSRPS